MKGKHLKEFQVIAQLENLTRASERLHIAQPALSRSIHQLEEELGVSLFYRSRKGIHLNENGKILLDYINRENELLRLCAQELELRNRKAPQQVRLVNQVAFEGLAQLIIAFHNRYPHILLQIINNDSPAPFVDHSFDFAVNGPYRFRDQPIEQAALLQEELCAAVPPSHPFAGRPHINLRQIIGQPLILTQAGADLRYQVEHYCRQVGFRPVSTFICDDYRMVASLIKMGRGISIVPSDSWGFQYDKNIRLIPIRQPKCQRLLMLFWSRDLPLSQEAEIFKAFALDYYSAMRAAEPSRPEEICAAER